MPDFSIFRRLATAALLVLLPATSMAQEATDEAFFRLELNAAAETDEGACRLTYVATNGSGTDLERAAYEIGVFNTDGIVTQLIVLEFGALVDGKTKILRFALSGMPCGSISRIVVNDVAGCTAPGAADALSSACMTGLSATSRTAIQFGL